MMFLTNISASCLRSRIRGNPSSNYAATYRWAIPILPLMPLKWRGPIHYAIAKDCSSVHSLIAHQGREPSGERCGAHLRPCPKAFAGLPREG
jgi:hypothetical protein